MVKSWTSSYIRTVFFKLSNGCYEKRTADLSGGKERRDSKQLIIVAPPSHSSNTHPADPPDQLLPRRAALARCSMHLLLSWSAPKGDDIQRAEVMEDWQTPRSPPPFHRQAHPHPQPPRSGGGFVKGGKFRNLQHDIDHQGYYWRLLLKKHDKIDTACCYLLRF